MACVFDDCFSLSGSRNGAALCKELKSGSLKGLDFDGLDFLFFRLICLRNCGTPLRKNCDKSFSEVLAGRFHEA